jgi:hypothetical protein
MHFSPVVASKPRPLPGFTRLHFIDLAELGVADSPVSVLDDFRVAGLPFSPHPHAGLAAVTYVFEDSPGGVRSRASTGADLVLGPGAIIWTHAGSGIVHEEIPAEPGVELHGVQIFVNLSPKGKLTKPEVHYLEPGQVPEWHGCPGDRVRVVVGTFAAITSPLVPPEPFTLLDAYLGSEIQLRPARRSQRCHLRDGRYGHGQRRQTAGRRTRKSCTCARRQPRSGDDPGHPPGARPHPVRPGNSRRGGVTRAFHHERPIADPSCYHPASGRRQGQLAPLA